MRSMHSMDIVPRARNRQRHVVLSLLLLFAIGSFDYYWSHRLLVAGQDEYMTCSRPIKQSRTSKQINLPCEGMEAGKESWCNLPGPAYPWHAVRNFVFENQGLMRRMYGEVRQLSLLRMEFAGESNTLDDHVGSGRDFNEVFQPIVPTAFGPTPATTSELTSMLTAPAVEKSPSSEYRMVDDSDADVEFAPSATAAALTLTTESMAASVISIANPDYDEVNNVSDGGSSEKLTTLTDESAVDITTHDMLHDGLMMDTAPTEETPTTPALDEDEFGSSEEDGLVIILQTPSPPSNVSVHNVSETKETVLNDERGPNEENIEGKNRINHILFQDVEKSSSQSQPQQPQPTPSSPSSSPQPAAPPESQAPSANVEERVRSRVGVNACPVKEEVVAPYWANNTRGEILALLNLYPFEQYIHWEKCTNEHRQMYCRDGCRCEQQYRLHRLLAFDPSNECRGIFSDWFRFPSCCVCKCYFDEMPGTERISFNRSPRILDPVQESIQELDGPDVNGVDDSHFFYKYHHSFRHPRK